MTRTIKTACATGVCAIVIMAAPSARMAAAAQAGRKSAPAAQAGQKPAPAAAGQKAAPSVTLTGCLLVDGTQFKLSELEGAQAPKGRSWKTAFITKSTRDMDVVGASSAVRLQDHIGHKITVTGSKNGDTRLTARAIKHVSPSCS